MSLDYARNLWDRACNALKSAEALLTVSPDDAAYLYQSCGIGLLTSKPIGPR